MPVPPQSGENRSERFAAYIEARRFDPPRPLLTRAAGLVAAKDHALDAGAGALNATKYLLAAGFRRVTAFDSSPTSQRAAAELASDQVSFVSSRYEDFSYPRDAFDLVNAEFSLPFVGPGNIAAVLAGLFGTVRPGGIFTGQLFGVNDSWNVSGSGMNFQTRADVEHLLRGWTLVELEEEDHPGATKLGEAKHWHIFHILARKRG
jgi:SAM-dependent methyltransferase